MTFLQLNRHLGFRLLPETARRLLIITGARQVGKTTLARASYPRLRYVNLDAVEDREALRRVPSHEWARQVGPAILDEAHKEPSLFEKVKLAFDAGDLDFTVLLGSAQILLLGKIRETLAGRVFLYELWPLSLGELVAGAGPPTSPLFVRLLTQGRPIGELLKAEPEKLLGEEESKRLGAASHLGLWGGMPELLRLSEQERRDWLRSYHDTYLQRDLADLARLRDLEPFLTFQRLAALRSGGLLSYSELARDAGTSAGTARNYLEYLRISYQVFLLRPFGRNVTSAVMKAPKLYWSDVGVARHLTTNWGPPAGALFETLVVAEAMKLLRTLSLEAEATFYRTRSGLEIDLILETPAGVIAFEVKGRESWARSDLRSFRSFAEAMGERFLGGIVVTLAGVLQPADAKGRFWAVPFHRLFS